MSSCCDPSSASRIQSTVKSLTVALAGNPNSGKTTIFNALTGLRQKTANYPGVTIEKKTGRCKLPNGSWTNIIDLPGTYSLIARSPDEQVAMEVLRGLRADTPAPDVVVVVVDASNLQRNLYLVSQLIELGRPMVVALNMMDVAQRRGMCLSAEAMERELGVPVIPVVGHRRLGIRELKDAILRARCAPMPDWPLPREMQEELGAIDSAINSVNRTWCGCGRRENLAERLLIRDFQCTDCVGSHPQITAQVDAARARLLQLGIDPMQADVEAHYLWIESVANKSTSSLDESATGDAASPRTLQYQSRQQHLSDKVDRIFLHKFLGLAVFGTIMAGLFVSIFFLADPIMGWTEELIGWLGGFVAQVLPEGPIQDLWTDGIVAGVGAVVVFVPQIAMLFLFLAILEDSGYLARAAFLMDRLLGKVGLHGKSFIPLLSSFACAIPGILASRTIENRRDRLATIFVAPFMSCSARLPVYALLIGTFFAGYSALVQGGILLACYALGILAAVVTAWFFKRTFLKGAPEAFILELPSYKVPQISQVARVMWVNTREFLVKAGTIIFCLSIVLWALMYYPRLSEERRAEVAQAAEWIYWSDYSPESADGPSQVHEDAAAEAAARAVAGEELRHSLAGRFGHLIEPVIEPLGYDWKMGVGLVGAFAAREMFVGTMGIVYSVGGDDSDTAPLAQQMRADTYPNGKPVWTPLVATSLLIWFVLAMQCMSTLAVVKRETGGWKWPIAMLLYMNGVAYGVCLIVYQVGRIWFV